MPERIRSLIEMQSVILGSSSNVTRQGDHGQVNVFPGGSRIAYRPLAERARYTQHEKGLGAAESRRRGILRHNVLPAVGHLCRFPPRKEHELLACFITQGPSLPAAAASVRLCMKRDAHHALCILRLCSLHPGLRLPPCAFQAPLQRPPHLELHWDAFRPSLLGLQACPYIRHGERRPSLQAIFTATHKAFDQDIILTHENRLHPL